MVPSKPRVGQAPTVLEQVRAGAEVEAAATCGPLSSNAEATEDSPSPEERKVFPVEEGARMEWTAEQGFW